MSIAQELQDQLSCLEINQEQRRVANTLLKAGTGANLLLLKADTERRLGLLTEEFKFLNLHDELFRALQTRRPGVSDSAAALAAAQEKYQLTLLKAAEPPTSLRAQLRYYQSRAMVHQLMGEPAGVFADFSQVNALWNEHPAYKKEEFNRYLDDAFNLLHATFQHPPPWQRRPHLLDRLASETPNSAHDRLVLFQRTATFRLIYAINFDFRRPAVAVLEPIEAGLTTHELNPISDLTIRFNAAVLHFIQDNAIACEQWLLSILAQRQNILRPDILQAARLLRLLTLIDQALDADFIEAQLRNEQRQLAKLAPGRLQDFSRVLFRTIRQFLYLAPSETKTFMAAAQQEMQKTGGSFPWGWMNC
ncbi:MAG: hypothetical protein HC821_04880 [Lewinella sp.]|nr:hypothetical protein [Lewinella sp.]